MKLPAPLSDAERAFYLKTAVILAIPIALAVWHAVEMAS